MKDRKSKLQTVWSFVVHFWVKFIDHFTEVQETYFLHFGKEISIFIAVRREIL